MKLFLFSASVFYILGLKVISKIEILPIFQQKSESTETIYSPSKKSDALFENKSTVQVKKDTLTTMPDKNYQLPEKSIKNSIK